MAVVGGEARECKVWVDRNRSENEEGTMFSVLGPKVIRVVREKRRNPAERR